MVSERAAYLAALSQSHRIRTVVSIYDHEEEFLGNLATNVISGQVDVDTTRDIERSLSLTLADTAGTALFDVDNDAAIFADKFLGVEYHVWVSSIPKWVVTPVFFGPVTRLQSDGGLINVEAQDKSSLLQQPVVWGRFLKNASLLDVDTDVRYAATLLRLLLKATGERERNFEFTGFEQARLPKGFKLPKEPETLWAVLKRIVQAANARSDTDRYSDHRIFYDGRGRVRVESMANSGFHFTDDPAAGVILNQPVVSFDLESFRNTVVVKINRGQGQRPLRPVVRSLPAIHPLSPQSLSRNGRKRYIVQVVENDHIRTRKRAVRVAENTRRRLSTETVQVSFDSLPIPHLIPGSRSHLTAGEMTHSFVLNRFTLPLRASDSMSVGYLKRVKTGPTKPLKARGKK
jgi:hypothetical protein